MLTDREFLFTSESVTEGHPDKICDQISDAILDEILKQDSIARVACETTVTTGNVFIMGEITTSAYVAVDEVARKVISEIGYTSSCYGFDANTCGVLTSIHTQSPDIAMGVDNSLERNLGCGAGDQGMMFGYACTDTPELMPLPIALAHRLAKRLSVVRKNGEIPYLRPDGKTQVTVKYRDKKPIAVDTVVVSSQHDESIDYDRLERDIKEKVIASVIPKELLVNTKYFINPTGRFVVGGPHGDSGLTGRKIIVDTYGGWGRHGGGAFSGKDPTKVDRSAAYAARWVAKNIVAAELAESCEVQLSYAIGVASPISINVNTFGTAKVDEEIIENAVKQIFDLTPSGIIEKLQLRLPIYRQLAAYGHMGREDLNVPWEKTDKILELKQACGIV